MPLQHLSFGHLYCSSMFSPLSLTNDRQMGERGSWKQKTSRKVLVFKGNHNPERLLFFNNKEKVLLQDDPQMLNTNMLGHLSSWGYHFGALCQTEIKNPARGFVVSALTINICMVLTTNYFTRLHLFSKPMSSQEGSGHNYIMTSVSSVLCLWKFGQQGRLKTSHPEVSLEEGYSSFQSGGHWMAQSHLSLYFLWSGKPVVT